MLEFNEYKIKEEVPAVNENGFYIESRYSDEDIEKIKNKTLKILSPVYDILGIKFTPEGDDSYTSLGIAGIKENFDLKVERTGSFEDNVALPTDSTEYANELFISEIRNEVSTPLIGEDDWVIGQTYTDNEIKKIKRNLRLATPASYDFIGVKYKAMTNEADISVPRIGEEDWVIGDRYSDNDLERIKKNLLAVDVPAFDILGSKYSSNIIQNSSVFPMIGEDGWNISSELSDKELDKVKDNKLILKKPLYDLIGYKYTSERRQGEQFAIAYDEETSTQFTFNELIDNNRVQDLAIGEEGWYLGNDFSDNDILRIKKNTLKISDNIYLIGSKYISVKEDGERLNSIYEEEFEIEILKYDIKIEAPLVNEDNWDIGQKYADSELNKILDKTKRITSPVFDLIGRKISPIKKIINSLKI